MKLIYVAIRNVSVFDSQVLALLNYYAESGRFEKIILLLGNHYKDTRTKVPKNLSSKIVTVFFKHYPQYPIIEQFTVSSLKRELKRIDKPESYVIHVRNDVLSHYVYKAFDSLRINPDKIISDVRGAGFEQIAEYSNKNRAVLTVKLLQRKQVFNSLSKIKHISVVSKSLQKYISSKISQEHNPKIFVNSCLANSNFFFNNKQRIQIRQKLGILDNETMIVLATGGDNAWQNTDVTIRHLVNNNFKVLNLSKRHFSHQNVYNIFVPYKEVPGYLSAADIAVIWREKSITNKVASPVKFSEYVCCGLPVITNDSIDLITEFVRQNDSGLVINSLAELSEQMIKTLSKINRKELSNISRNIFGIEAIANQYINLYQSMLDE